MEDISKLTPIRSRVKLPDLEAWDLHVKDAHGDEAQDPRIQWEVDVHNTLSAVRYLLDEDAVLGLLRRETRGALKIARQMLEREFPPDHQEERPF